MASTCSGVGRLSRAWTSSIVGEGRRLYAASNTSRGSAPASAGPRTLLRMWRTGLARSRSNRTYSGEGGAVPTRLTRAEYWAARSSTAAGARILEVPPRSTEAYVRLAKTTNSSKISFWLRFGSSELGRVSPCKTASTSLSSFGHHISKTLSRTAGSSPLSPNPPLIDLSSLRISSLENALHWNCSKGPLTSLGDTPNKSGQTRADSKCFEIAPASKIIQGAARFSAVRMKMPTFDSDSSLAISVAHRAPFAMSSGVKYGFTAWITPGIHFRNISAIFLLRAPRPANKHFHRISCFSIGA